MQYKSITRVSLLSYLDDYLQRGSATVLAHRSGLRTIYWSYEKLVRVSQQTARELAAAGIEAGDRVILCGRNTSQWAAAFWACLSLGAVAVPLDQESSGEFVSLVQQETSAKFLFADRDAACRQELPLPSITLEDLVETVSSQSDDNLRTPDLSDNSLAEIIFTSGTTSAPRGVMLTHGNLLANLLPLEYEIGKYLTWERLVHPIRFLNLVPLSHVFGQFMGLFVPQLLGGEVHFHDSLNPASIVERTRKHRISVIVLVPRILESLREWVERQYSAGAAKNFKRQIRKLEHSNPLRSWWTFREVHRTFGLKFWAFLSGGATLETQTEKFWRTLGFAVLQGYGMTETASMISVTHPFKLSRGTIGQLMPGYELKLDQGGEILVRGPSVSPGYWTANGVDSGTKDEWLHTGDVGTIDDSGQLFYKGRTKEVIVSASGLNIHPEDLENALNRQPEVRSSCVVTWHGPHGEEPMAVLILRDPHLEAASIIERANAGLAEYQQIRQWYLWSEPDFPTTATYKVLKREVAAKIERLMATADRQKNEEENSVISEAARISGQPLGAHDEKLRLGADLKLDSLGRIELLSALEDRYQIDIDEQAFTEATTIGDVERMVRGEVASTAKTYPFPTWPRRFPITWLRLFLFYSIILPITRVMSRMRVEGRPNLRMLKDPALFVANHVTLADHALILVGLPLRLRHRLAIAMDGERLRNWVHPPAETGLFMRLKLLAEYVLVNAFFEVFPLPKKSGFRRSFEYAAECIERRRSLLVFPEGERAPRGQMHMSEFKLGIGKLISELGIPVVPVKLHGLYELKRRQQYFASSGMVRVSFSEPISFARSLDAREVTEKLQGKLESM